MQQDSMEIGRREPYIRVLVRDDFQANIDGLM